MWKIFPILLFTQILGGANAFTIHESIRSRQPRATTKEYYNKLLRQIQVNKKNVEVDVARKFSEEQIAVTIERLRQLLKKRQQQGVLRKTRNESPLQVIDLLNVIESGGTKPVEAPSVNYANIPYIPAIHGNRADFTITSSFSPTILTSNQQGQPQSSGLIQNMPPTSVVSSFLPLDATAVPANATRLNIDTCAMQAGCILLSAALTAAAIAGTLAVPVLTAVAGKRKKRDTDVLKVPHENIELIISDFIRKYNDRELRLEEDGLNLDLPKEEDVIQMEKKIISEILPVAQNLVNSKEETDPSKSSRTSSSAMEAENAESGSVTELGPKNSVPVKVRTQFLRTPAQQQSFSSQSQKTQSDLQFSQQQQNNRQHVNVQPQFESNYKHSSSQNIGYKSHSDTSSSHQTGALPSVLYQPSPSQESVLNQAQILQKLLEHTKKLQQPQPNHLQRLPSVTNSIASQYQVPVPGFQVQPTRQSESVSKISPLNFLVDFSVVKNGGNPQQNKAPPNPFAPSGSSQSVPTNTLQSILQNPSAGQQIQILDNLPPGFADVSSTSSQQLHHQFAPTVVNSRPVAENPSPLRGPQVQVISKPLRIGHIPGHLRNTLASLQVPNASLKPETVHFYNLLCQAILEPDVPLNRITAYIAEKCLVMRFTGYLKKP